MRALPGRGCNGSVGHCSSRQMRTVQCRAMQPGENPARPQPAGGMPYQQPYTQPNPAPQQQQYVQQQQQQQQQPAPYGSIARRPATGLQRVGPPAPLQQQQQQTVYIEMSQVIGKQVITRTTGRLLGVLSTMWVDPVRYEVVSLDLDDKKGVGSQRICNFPLSRLTQIGDVVLVHDEEVLYDQPLDGRYGYYILMGMEVRTRSGEFLGKVRDFTFSPDTGAIARIVYDDFGLSFLPVSFFDTYSLPMSDAISMGVGGLIVSEEARYRERRESPGLFAAIPSIFRSLNSGGNRVAGALTDGYRQDGNVAGYLPQGYTYAQWENDVRRWEQETGMSYEQYTRMREQQQPQLSGGGRTPRALPAPAAQQPAARSQASYGSPTYPYEQQQQGAYPEDQYSYQGVPPQPQQPQYQQGYQKRGSTPYDPRARVGAQPTGSQPPLPNQRMVQPQQYSQAVQPPQQGTTSGAAVRGPQQAPMQQQQPPQPGWANAAPLQPPQTQPQVQQQAVQRPQPQGGSMQQGDRPSQQVQPQAQPAPMAGMANGSAAGPNQQGLPLGQGGVAGRSTEPEKAAGRGIEQWMGGTDSQRVPEVVGGPDAGWASSSASRNGVPV